MQDDVKINCPQCNAVFAVEPNSMVSICPSCNYQVININLSNNILEGEEKKPSDISFVSKEQTDVKNKPSEIDTYSTLKCPDDRLFMDFKSTKQKHFIRIWIQETKERDVISNGQKKTYHLDYGEYTVFIKLGRKTFGQIVLIAPGDKPVTIHCSWDKKMTIDIEQSEYAEKIIQKRMDRGGPKESDYALIVLDNIDTVVTILTGVSIFVFLGEFIIIAHFIWGWKWT